METPYVIKKNGMYYAHNSCGYVSRVIMAELYDKDYAIAQEKMCKELQAIPITDCLMGAEEVQAYIDRLEVMRDTMASFNT